MVEKEQGYKFWKDVWEYSEYGVYIADTPSGGHEMILLDNRKKGKDREPEVVYIDEKNDDEIVFLSKDIETFVRGLVLQDVYSDE